MGCASECSRMAVIGGHFFSYMEKKMKKDPSFSERVKEIKTNINSKR